MSKVIIGIIIIVIAGAAASVGYYSGKNVQPQVTPTPESSPTVSSEPPIVESESTEETNEIAIQSSFVPATTRPKSQWVQGTTIMQPTVIPVTPEPTIPPDNSEFSISFVDTPNQVQSGEQFKVSWKINGQAGTSGTTKLNVSYNASAQDDGSNSSVNSKNNQSFSFTIPQTFAMQLKYGGPSGTVHVTATAEIGTRSVSATHDIQLIN